MKRKWIFALVLSVFSTTASFAADDDSKAFSCNFTYRADFWRGLQGPIQNRTFYVGFADAQFQFDNEKLLNLKGNTALLELINTNGQRPNYFLQSYQGIDNIEPSINTTKIYQLWTNQSIIDSLSIKIGVVDINTDYYVLNSANTLIGPSYAMGWDIGQTGINGPSTYPTPGAGFSITYTPRENYYVQFALFDAIAGNIKNPRYANMRFSTNDGYLSLVEGGHTFTNGKIGLGAWRYTRKTPVLLTPIDETDPENILPTPGEHNKGIYGIAEYPLYQDSKFKNRVLTAFIHYGIASAHINNFNRALAAGLTFNSPFTNRAQDILSLGISPAWTSHYARQANNTLPAAEAQYEITYVAQINKFLAIQPDIQYIKYNGNPNSTRKNSIILGTRFTVTLT